MIGDRLLRRIRYMASWLNDQRRRSLLLATIILDNNRLGDPKYWRNYVDFISIFVNISVLKDLNDSFIYVEL